MIVKIQIYIEYNKVKLNCMLIKLIELRVKNLRLFQLQKFTLLFYFLIT